MEHLHGWTLRVVCLVLYVLLSEHGPVESKQGGGVSIHSLSVESEGVNRAARASIVVKTMPDNPVNVYWADVTSWLPAEGHPNYTITERTWNTDKYMMFQSTIELKKMLLAQLSYYYDYDQEHIMYYLPMSADVRSGDGEFIYHQTLDIPEKPAYQNHSETRFRVLERPETVIHYTEGGQVELQWRFLSRDENEFTMWRTVFEAPTEYHDLDYADHMLYSEGFPDEVIQFENLNISKEVRQLGKLYLVTFTLNIEPAEEDDESLYVVFIKSRKLLPWEKTLNLRLSTRLLMENVTSLLHDDVALAISHCDGNDVPMVEDAAYVSLNRSVENCVKCEAYGNQARDLVFTKGRYLVQKSKQNAIVYSSYYPETKSVLYTFRTPDETAEDTGEFYCRAILKDNRIISRKFHVAWTEPVTLEAVILSVNQSEAEIRCTASGNPRPKVTIWRCVGESFCELKKVATQPGFQLNITSNELTTTGLVSLHMPAARLKQEAILCHASNNFDSQEDWLLFDDRIEIEATELEESRENNLETFDIVNDKESSQSDGKIKELNQNETQQIEGDAIFDDDALTNGGVDIEDGEDLDMANHQGNSENKDSGEVADSGPLVEDEDTIAGLTENVHGIGSEDTKDQYDQPENEVVQAPAKPWEKDDDDRSYQDLDEDEDSERDIFAYVKSDDGDF